MSIGSGLRLEQRDYMDAQAFLDTEIHQTVTDEV